MKSITEDCEFTDPVTEAQLEMVEGDLHIKFTNELRSLLLETDGVIGEYGTDLVWPLYRIKKENLFFRSSESFKELYMPFDCLLFFGASLCGDQFAYSINDGVIRKNDVFVWDHESDSRVMRAGSLKSFIERWLNGTLDI